MDNLNDLKTIWLTADTKSLPDAGEMVHIVKKYRNKKLIKFVAVIVAALLLTGLMMVIVFIYKSTMVTTRIGEGCIIFAGLILAATNTNSLNRFYKLNDLSNRDFIKFLEHTRVRQNFYYKKTQVICLILCSVGLLCYLYEPVHKQLPVAIAAYSITIIYLLVAWLYMRPRAFKKQELKMKETIKKLENISSQL
jgi:hypothetical protein